MLHQRIVQVKIVILAEILQCFGHFLFLVTFQLLNNIKEIPSALILTLIKLGPGVIGIQGLNVLPHLLSLASPSLVVCLTPSPHEML